MRSDRGRVRTPTEAPTGYASGPGAPLVARADALTRAASARTLVLVEGVSDQIAVETLALRLGRDLREERTVVVPIGGAHAIASHLERFGPHGSDQVVTGLCDAAEEPLFRRALAGAGIGSASTRDALARLGFFVCDEDLEDELVRAAGRGLVESLLEAHGDLGALRTLQHQPAWRGRELESQVRRFLGAGARRKSRYARLLVEAVPMERMPAALVGVLGATCGRLRP